MKFEITFKGDVYFVEVENREPTTENEFLSYGGSTTPTLKTNSTPCVAENASAPSGDNTVNAPLPGAIVGIKVAVGQTVKKGQVVAILEAMKMENEISTPTDGTVKAIIAPKGTSVAVGDPIIELG